MPQILEAEQTRPGVDRKGFSCLTCRQRKIKCDRCDPCSNCTRTARECSFVPPQRGKRRRRRAPKEGLHTKLKRYEEMLKSYGADIEPSSNDISDGETMLEGDIDIAEDAEFRDERHASSSSLDKIRTRIVSKNGSSRYFDKYTGPFPTLYRRLTKLHSGLWSNLGDEFRHPEEEGLHESVARATAEAPDRSLDLSEEHDLVLGNFPKVENLASLHHPFHILQKMLNFYIDRVDPLMKLLHIPTFWSTLTNALQSPRDMSKGLEALIFAFYLATTTSLDDNECCCLLGEPKLIICARYNTAARQALVKASLLKTSSLMTLQAYLLFIISMRDHYQNDSLFILSGIAVRLGRRMGLHRDGTLLGLSPFETEMRRRVWWHIVHVDSRTSDYSGTKRSMDLFLGDAKMPLNVEDEDLNPDMVNPPPERTGITTIVLCLIRCEVMDLLREFTPQLSDDVRWENLSSTKLTLPEKDSMINQLEDTFEKRYLRYYDPSNPLHHLSTLMARYSVCKMKLYAHSPRQFASCGVTVPQTSRDIIFTNGMKSLEYGNSMHSNQILRKFMWQIGTGYVWDTLLYVLIEARHRKIGPEVDHMWQLIGGVFDIYPQVFSETTEALYAAIGSWTLQVWDDCVAARKLGGLQEPSTPGYITAIRRCRRPTADSAYKLNGSIDDESAMGNSTGSGELQSQRRDKSPTDIDLLDSYDFSNLLSFDLEPDEWVQWERLLAGHSV